MTDDEERLAEIRDRAKRDGTHFWYDDVYFLLGIIDRQALRHDRLRAWAEDEQAKRTDERSENARLRAALEAVETVYGSVTRYCPWCEMMTLADDGPATHTHDCPRQQALGLEGGGLAPIVCPQCGAVGYSACGHNITDPARYPG